MKFSAIRLLLSVSGSLLLSLGLFWLVAKEAVVTAYAPPNSGEAVPNATFHLWRINEIFSCADGSIQFVEMVTDSDSQQFLTGQELRATSGAQIRSFIFPGDSGSPTANKSLLIATTGFGSLPGGITPDFVLTSTVIFTDGAAGSVALIGANTLSYGAGQLPLDGINSWGQGSVTAVNSPRNFAGQQGSVSCPLAVSKTAPAAADPGGLITYTLTVTSSGASSNTNTVLTDTLPASTTFVSATGGISPVNGVLTWTLGTMATSGPTSVASRTFVVNANAPAGTPIVNINYGVRSDQTRAKGSPVQVLLTGADSFIYLPVIIKEFNFVSDHAADLP